MTREEKIKEAAMDYASYLDGTVQEYDKSLFEAFKDGAEWADKHPAKNQTVTILGCLYRYSDGTLSLFRENPSDFMTNLNENDFPSVTHQNSPKKVKVTIELEEE